MNVDFYFFISGNTVHALLQTIPSVLRSLQVSHSHQRLSFLTRRSHSSNSFSSPNSWHVVQTDRDREKLSKFKLKLIDRAKFDQRWSVQKSRLKFEQFLYRRPCAVCKSGNVCHRAPHKVERRPNGEHSKHDSLGDGKADRIERVKMWEGFFTASLSSVPVQYNLCASDTLS